MQFFVREHGAMIAAPVQCDVDGIPKGSHDASLIIVAVIIIMATKNIEVKKPDPVFTPANL
jgi:hypothetical protein